MNERVDRLREDLVLFNREARLKRGNHSLTATQLQALGRLDREGSMSARELADLERVTPQSIARTIAALEALGMVHRTADPDDGRATIVTITALGHETLSEDRVRHSEWLDAILHTRCTETERELLFMAGRLLRRLTESGDSELRVHVGASR